MQFSKVLSPLIMSLALVLAVDILHGANDQDVSSVMGEKHGQFNTEWGRYDSVPCANGYLNTANFITPEDQQKIAKAYFRTFLDTSFGIDDTYSGLLSDNTAYLSSLPQTVYVTDYMDSEFDNAYSFEDSVNVVSGSKDGTSINCEGMKHWTFKPDKYGAGGEGENYVLDCKWKKDSSPAAVFGFSVDMTSGGISFRIADMREENAETLSELTYTVELTDANGKTVSAEKPVFVYPTLAVKLYKQDVLFGGYEYKHQMQSVRLTQEMFGTDTDLDFGHIKSMKIVFDGSADGEVIIDNIGIYQ